MEFYIRPTATWHRAIHLFIFVAANGLDANGDPKSRIFISLSSGNFPRRCAKGCMGHSRIRTLQRSPVPVYSRACGFGWRSPPTRKR